MILASRLSIIAPLLWHTFIPPAYGSVDHGMRSQAFYPAAKGFNQFVAIVLSVALWFLTGCESVEIREQPQGWQPFTGATVDNKSSARPLGFVKSLRLFDDQAEYNPSNEFVRRIRDNFRETNLFVEVVFEKPAAIYPHVELSLEVTQHLEENQGLNFTKMMLTAVTLGLLGPVLPQYADGSSEMRLKVVRSDGLTKEYSARSSGTAKASLNLQSQKAVLWSRVTSNNLNSIMSQIIADAEFFKPTDPQPEKGDRPPI